MPTFCFTTGLADPFLEDTRRFWAVLQPLLVTDMSNHNPTDLSPPLPQSILMGYMPDERGIVRTVFGYTERDLRVYADQYTVALRTALEALRAKHETQTKYLFQMQEAAKDLARQVEALRTALHKIHEIRNDIIKTQTLGWSAHVYPLVAALSEVGLEYEEPVSKCKHQADPRGCYRVRCQLGRECVEAAQAAKERTS